MISSVFAKLSLISLGTLGVGLGGYFVYKNTFSKKVDVEEETKNRASESSNHPRVDSTDNLPKSPLSPEITQDVVHLGGSGDDVNQTDTRQREEERST